MEGFIIMIFLDYYQKMLIVFLHDFNLYEIIENFN